MISGFLTPKGHSDYTYPPELLAGILNVAGEYSPDPYDFLYLNQDLPNFVRWMQVREQVAMYLHERYRVDFFMSVIQALDQLQHLFWDILIDETARCKPPGNRIWPCLKRCYAIADTVIQHRLDMLDDETTLFLTSDHGFQQQRLGLTSTDGWLRKDS